MCVTKLTSYDYFIPLQHSPSAFNYFLNLSGRREFQSLKSLKTILFILFVHCYKRHRSTVRNDCPCPGSSIITKTCGNSCDNGGTPRINDCICPLGFSGSCCESRKFYQHILESILLVDS